MTTHDTVCLLRGERLPPGPNALLRMHWAKRRKFQEDIKLDLVRCNYILPPFEGPVEIVYTRKYCRVPMDWDNAAGSFKLLGDALVELGVITDDNPKVVPRFAPRQEKVAREKEAGYTVEIRAVG